MDSYQLSKYIAVMAHERTIHTDVLFGLLKDDFLPDIAATLLG